MFVHNRIGANVIVLASLLIMIGVFLLTGCDQIPQNSLREHKVTRSHSQVVKKRETFIHDASRASTPPHGSNTMMIPIPREPEPPKIPPNEAQ